MIKTIFIPFLLIVVFSCKSSINSLELSKGEKFFITQVLEKKRELKFGKHLIFILNQSSCQPCEDKITAFVTSNEWNNLNKLFVVTEDRNPLNEEIDNHVVFKYKDLASYGLIRSNGTILILNNNDCVFLESIDVNHLDEIKSKIHSVLSQN
ncbi:MAG: hypothetical protein M9916_05295 [Crocinitomicaceae bacterium]|nr:hypothetical protein [Crocinitomicaceae bacterium]